MVYLIERDVSSITVLEKLIVFGVDRTRHAIHNFEWTLSESIAL